MFLFVCLYAFQNFSSSLLWQPIPVHTVPAYEDKVGKAWLCHWIVMKRKVRDNGDGGSSECGDVNGDDNGELVMTW